MKAGFVNIFGKPNAGKSTLLNALIGEKLAIVSSKVQTTRHRIKAILTSDEYQIVFSDTPGIIQPKYKLHEKMMQAVKGSLEDADVAIFLMDVRDDKMEVSDMFASLKLKTPALLVLNKVDLLKHTDSIADLQDFFVKQPYCRKVITVSALRKSGLTELLNEIVALLPEGAPFFDGDDLSDLPSRFFVAELIREQVYHLFEEEIPYHTAVLIQAFQQKDTLVKITADIIVQRETQKAILIGERGKMIKELGTRARIEIEKFLNTKVFLELFVKVRPKWRDNDIHLKEYGY